MKNHLRKLLLWSNYVALCSKAYERKIDRGKQSKIHMGSKEWKGAAKNHTGIYLFGKEVSLD